MPFWPRRGEVESTAFGVAPCLIICSHPERETRIGSSPAGCRHPRRVQHERDATRLVFASQAHGPILASIERSNVAPRREGKAKAKDRREGDASAGGQCRSQCDGACLFRNPSAVIPTGFNRSAERGCGAPHGIHAQRAQGPVPRYPNGIQSLSPGLRGTSYPG